MELALRWRIAPVDEAAQFGWSAWRLAVPAEGAVNTGWLVAQFLLCAAVIAVSGYVLSRSADRLAEAHGWGRGWVGLALLATVTSLPELTAGLSAVVLIGAPNLAVGNALGACVVNLAFLVVVDLLQRSQPMYRRASAAHLLSAGFGVVMLGFVALSLATGPSSPVLLHVGLYSPVLLGLYLVALRALFVHEQSFRDANAVRQPAAAKLEKDWLHFGGAALAVLAAGTWLPELADGLANKLSLSRSFVGTVFMALVTTLPEMAVTISALRLGALDMAIGNLLGSNLFNIAILAVEDIAYTRGPLLGHVSSAHAGSAATALAMTGLVVVGLVMRPQGRVMRVASWVSVGLVAAYLLNAALISLAAA